MELPIVNTVDIRGTKILVRAVPFSLALKLYNARGDFAKQMEVGAEIIKRCCSCEDGSPVDMDCITLNDITTLSNAAYNKDDSSDF